MKFFDFLKALQASSECLRVEDVLDALWLATLERKLDLFGTDITTLPDPPASGAIAREERKKEETSSVPRSSALDRLPSAEDDMVSVHAKGDVSSSEKRIKASPVDVPSGRVLKDPLQMARALEPFRRPWLSKSSFELDEELTVEAIAQSNGQLQAVFKSAKERWFDVAVVSEDEPTLAIWNETLREFIQVLRNTGAFRIIRSWKLRIPKNDDEYAVVESPTGSRQDARSLKRPNGRLLILFAMHGQSKKWFDDSYARLLATWTVGSCVALLNLRPSSQWKRTLLGEPEGQCHTHIPGAVASKLVSSRYWWSLEEQHESDFAIPTFSLESQRIRKWSRMQMGASDRCPAFILNSDRHLGEDLGSLSPVGIERSVALLREASENAFRLAVFLSPSRFTIPVARLVQECKLGKDANDLNIAEILLSELVFSHAEPQGDIDPSMVFYEFHQEARDVLLRSLSIADAEAVAGVLEQQVSKYVEAVSGRSVSFQALVPDPDGNFDLPAECQSFAHLGVALLGLSSRRALGKSNRSPEKSSLRIRVVGSPVSEDNAAEFSTFCWRVGEAIARRNHSLVITSFSKADGDALRGFASVAPAGEVIFVLHPSRSFELPTNFPQLSFRVFAAEDYRVSGALDHADAVFAVGGKAFTMRSCEEAASRQMPIVAWGQFGGSAESFRERALELQRSRFFSPLSLERHGNPEMIPDAIIVLLEEWWAAEDGVRDSNRKQVVRSICRIQLKRGESWGFLISPSLIVTSSLGLPTIESAQLSVVFSEPHREYKLAPDRVFVSAPGVGFAIVAVQGDSDLETRSIGRLADNSNSGVQQKKWVQMFRVLDRLKRPLEFQAIRAQVSDVSGSNIHCLNGGQKEISELGEGLPILNPSGKVIAIQHQVGMGVSCGVRLSAVFEYLKREWKMLSYPLIETLIPSIPKKNLQADHQSRYGNVRPGDYCLVDFVVPEGNSVGVGIAISNFRVLTSLNVARAGKGGALARTLGLDDARGAQLVWVDELSGLAMLDFQVSDCIPKEVVFYNGPLQEFGSCLILMSRPAGTISLAEGVFIATPGGELRIQLDPEIIVDVGSPVFVDGQLFAIISALHEGYLAAAKFDGVMDDLQDAKSQHLVDRKGSSERLRSSITKSFNLSKLVTDLVRRIESERIKYSKEKPVKLVMDLDPIVFVEANEFEIERALYGIALNMLKHGDLGRELRLSLRRSEGRCSLSFENFTISAVALSGLSNVFDFGFRSGKVRKERSEDGVGIFAAKEIIERNGGLLSSGVTQRGGDYLFKIEISFDLARSPVAVRSSRKKTVLLVFDSVFPSEAFASAFSGFSLEVQDSVLGAILYFQEGKSCDVLVLDLNTISGGMAGDVDGGRFVGMEMLRRITKMLWMQIPVVILSDRSNGRLEQAVKEEVLKLGLKSELFDILPRLEAAPEVLREVVDRLVVRAEDAVRAEAPSGDVLGVGSKIGRYTIEELLASGGFGSVYRASDSTSGEIVAIRISSVGSEVLAVLKGLPRHRALVSVLDVGSLGDRLSFFVTEYVPGVYLDEFIKSKDLTVLGRLHLFLGIAEGVEFLHWHDLVNSRPSPSNILVDRQGNPRIIAFGASREYDAVSGVHYGSFRYAAPQLPRVGGRGVFKYDDVWALGVILLELFTGRSPRDALRAEEKRHDPGWWGDLPSELIQLATKCLSMTPENRPSANEIVRAVSLHLASTASSQQSYVVREIAVDVSSIEGKQAVDILGREQQLAMLLSNAMAGHSTVVIGEAGSGKTALAIEVKWRLSTSKSESGKIDCVIHTCSLLDSSQGGQFEGQLRILLQSIGGGVREPPLGSRKKLVSLFRSYVDGLVQGGNSLVVIFDEADYLLNDTLFDFLDLFKKTGVSSIVMRRRWFGEDLTVRESRAFQRLRVIHLTRVS